MIEKTRDATHFDNRVFSGMIFYLWCRYDRCKCQSSTDAVNYIYYLYIKSCTSISYLLMFHRSRKSKEKSVFTMIFNVVFLLFPAQNLFTDTLLGSKGFFLSTLHTCTNSVQCNTFQLQTAMNFLVPPSSDGTLWYPLFCGTHGYHTSTYVLVQTKKMNVVM